MLVARRKNDNCTQQQQQQQQQIHLQQQRILLKKQSFRVVVFFLIFFGCAFFLFNLYHFEVPNTVSHYFLNETSISTSDESNQRYDNNTALPSYLHSLLIVNNDEDARRSLGESDSETKQQKEVVVRVVTLSEEQQNGFVTTWDDDDDNDEGSASNRDLDTEYFGILLNQAKGTKTLSDPNEFRKSGSWQQYSDVSCNVAPLRHVRFHDQILGASALLLSFSGQ